MEMISAVGLAVVLFVTTNIDDVFVLVSFFANRRFRGREITLGQYIGISSLPGLSIRRFGERELEPFPYLSLGMHMGVRW